MGLPWIRFDTALPDNPKVLALIRSDEGRAAGFVYCCGLAYSGKHGTDGFIPREALDRINGQNAHAKLLCKVGLWSADGSAGWLINGWGEFQESSEDTQKRRVRAQAAARARWDKEPEA